MIGHAGHPEVEGTMGQYSNPQGGMYLVESPDDVWTLDVKNDAKLSFMTQTTLSVDDTSDVIDALRQRFPSIIGPRKDDICYATTNRQEAVKRLGDGCGLVLVVGSKNSSNSARLVDVALKAGAGDARLVDDAGDLDWSWFDGVETVGLTSGASVPPAMTTSASPSRMRWAPYPIDSAPEEQAETRVCAPARAPNSSETVPEALLGMSIGIDSG